jgi:hypothetical protein
MADCEVLLKCVFFNDKMAEMPAIAASMKRRLCQGDNAQCARWIVRAKLGPTGVPADLFPNQLERANRIIAGTGR